MPDYFPAFLDLRGRRCLVVGGGPVGERKVQELLACGADVLVVSPSVTPELRRLVEVGAITLRERDFARFDVRGSALVIAATGVVGIDRAVALAACRQRALVNVVDRPAQCSVIFPSVLRRGELQIAVSTGGRSPALAREIRRRLEGWFGLEWAETVEVIGQARRRARAESQTRETRIEAGEQVVAQALTLGSIGRTTPSPALRDGRSEGCAGSDEGATRAGQRRSTRQPVLRDYFFTGPRGRRNARRPAELRVSARRCGASSSEETSPWIT